ncbi:hypothetical protein F5X98DRAFT_387875 [Xylaria grammica]|nr:hypothetical protein F5X98DRAFT_387875 [Xylaria grammica]
MAPTLDVVVAWMSALSSVATAIVGFLTLVIVYIGVIEILSRNRMYRLGLSYESLGPWKVKVTNSSLLRLQWGLSTPSVSLEHLVKSDWKPKIVFPIGFPRNECTQVPRNIMAKASWVNFMQSLSLSPADDNLYDMRGVSEIMNGVIPMRWTGKDLAGICSILGFQSYEEHPSDKSPMTLPMQWSGPLGWLQFRSNENGCIAEFRSRMNLHEQISQRFHRYYNNYGCKIPSEHYYFQSRLWNSINGLCLQKDAVLYLGGRDQSKTDEEFDDDENVSENQRLNQLMSADFTVEEIQRKLFGKSKNRTAPLRRELEKARGGRRPTAGMSHRDDTDSFFSSILRDAMSYTRKEVFLSCPGLLSVTIHGELAHSRGLSIERAKEYRRIYVEAEDIDNSLYPYNLGNLYVDENLLGLVKEAVLLLQPDGFYFSPTAHVYQDICEMYHNIEGQLERKLFSIGSADQPGYQHLYMGMELCNELQLTRKTAYATFSVEDMRLLAKAVGTLKDVLGSSQGSGGGDLIWAMLYSPILSLNVRKWVEAASDDVYGFFSAVVTIKDGTLDCTGWVDSIDPVKRHNFGSETTTYKVPLVQDGAFSGAQVVAAITIIFITYFWIDASWITDVAAYDMTMPQSVLMY